MANKLANAGKQYLKGKAKKYFKKILLSIMIPWGLIGILIILALAGLNGLFTTNTALDTFSEEQMQQVNSYIDKKVGSFQSKDFYQLDQQNALEATYVQGYLRYLISENKIKTPVNMLEIYNQIDEIVKALEPTLEYKDAKIVTKTTKRVSKEVGDKNDTEDKQSTGTDKPKIETTTESQDIKLLTHAVSMFGDISYKYQDTVTKTVINAGKDNEETIEKTQPALVSQDITGQPYAKLREQLKKDGLSDDDMDVVIGMIINMKDKQWNWIFGNELEPPTIDIQNGKLQGVPAEYQPYFDLASKATGLPNWVLAAIAKQESHFNPNDSYGGAYGMMQFQKYDTNGSNLWEEAMNKGMASYLKNYGYSFSSNEDMWQIYLKDPKAQILVGAFELRQHFNYVLYKMNIVPKLDFNGNNMSHIKWDAAENDPQFVMILKKSFMCYNRGDGFYDCDVNTAPYNYPGNVFKYAMEYRSTSIMGDTGKGDNKVIESAISAGLAWVGKSPYSWGSGRNKRDQDAGRFDCSSLVYYCYQQAGIRLGDLGSVTTWTLLEQGTKVSPSDMKRGDIIFFDTVGANTHVGIYLGNNKFLNDSSSKGVSIGDLSNSYWSRCFNKEVRRIVK